MKKINYFLIYLISFSLFASVIPKKQIDSANVFIMEIFDKYKDDMELKILTASLDDTTQLLTHIDTSLEVFGDGKLNLELGLKKNTVFLKGGFIYELDEDDLTEVEIEEMTLDFISLMKEYNEKKLYKATLEITNDEVAIHYNLVLIPASPKAKSIKKIEIMASITHTKKPTVVVAYSGVFNAKEALIVSAQKGLTGMFRSLINQQVPSEDDMDRIYEVIEAVLDSFEQDEE